MAKLARPGLRSTCEISSFGPIPSVLANPNREPVTRQKVSLSSAQFQTFGKHRRKFVPSRVKNWICYGKRTSLEAKEKRANETEAPTISEALIDSMMEPTSLAPVRNEVSKRRDEARMTQIQMPKTIYDQQNMIKCFEEKNFYRLLFAFFQSFWNPLVTKSEIKKTENDIPETDRDRGQLRWSHAANKTFGPSDGGAALKIGSSADRTTVKKWSKTFVRSLSEQRWNLEYTRWRSRKFILFGRSEMKRLFRKVLFMKSESLLFAQIFLIPLAAFFGILYTFWTFSVSSTVTSKDYVPIAQKHQVSKFSEFESPVKLGTPESTSLAPRANFVRSSNEMSPRQGASRFGEAQGLGSGKSQHRWLSEMNKTQALQASQQSGLLKWRKILSENLLFEMSQKLQEAWSQGHPTSSREVFFSDEHPTLPLDLSSDDLIEFEEQQSLKFTPFFTSYKVDWSPTPGFADFLRFTNSASKIFILWASLAVLRSLRPVKANRPELQIQTSFLRPFQNRKRFRDLEGIEKFSSVLTTLTESLQTSFKDPLFYLALILPNLPFFQPFQKAIGKFRFFLFYGKQTSFFRKTMSAFLSILLPNERQKQGHSFPKGYLFIGPPGTGKTLLAQAIAGESKVNFICLSASEIQKQVDIGTRIGALRLRNLFEEARTSTPCILFFDEIDTLGRARVDSLSESKRAPDAHEGGQERGHLRSHSSKSFKVQPRSQRNQGRFSPMMDPTKLAASSKRAKKEQPIGQNGSALPQEIDLKLFTEFLVQMDNFSVNDGFLVIGTTNFLSSLDPAFVRSGRFDRILGLTYPPKQTRIAILKLHIQKKGNFFDSKLPWNIFGVKTKDLSPADLAKIVNESSLYLVNQLNALPVATKGGSSGGAFQKSTGNEFKLGSRQINFIVNSFGLLHSMRKSFFDFQPGLTHTAQSLREGFVKILESKK